jgi:uncharacterized protein (DUF2141 family)
MKKQIVLAILLIGVLAFSFAQDCEVTVEVSGVAPKAGTVYLAAFNSESTYKKNEALFSRKVDADGAIVQIPLTLPAGDYVVVVFQDLNMNQKMDANIIGMPKEPVGISNYDGKGIPGGFGKLKLPVTSSTKTIPIKLISIKK